MDPRQLQQTQRGALLATTQSNLFANPDDVPASDPNAACVAVFIRDTEAHPGNNFMDHPFFPFVEELLQSKQPNESGAAMGRRAAEILRAKTPTQRMLSRGRCWKCKKHVAEHPHPFDPIVRQGQPTWAGFYAGYDVYHNGVRASIKKVLSNGVVLTNGIVVRDVRDVRGVRDVRDPDDCRLVCDSFHPEVATPAEDSL